MTQRYDKPDASICKVWASDMYWAVADGVRGNSHAPWAVYTPVALAQPKLTHSDELPPGPWRPCHLVGEEPDSERTIADGIGGPESREVWFQAAVSGLWYKNPLAAGTISAVKCENVRVPATSTCECEDSEPRLTEQERAVLEALRRWALGKSDDEWVAVENAADEYAYDLLLARHSHPKVCEHCGQELPK